MIKNISILIRTDADEKIGIGHFMRCIALAKALKEQGCDIIWVTSTTNNLIIAKTEQVSKDIHFLSSNTDITETLRIIKSNTPFSVVLDGYIFDSKYQKEIYDLGIKVVVIDDYCHLKKYYAHMIVNQNYGAHKFDYNAMSHTKYLLGCEYVMLREEFYKYKGKKKEIKNIADNILVTMGGGDTQDNTLKILHYLLQTEFTLNIKIVFGACSKDYGSLDTIFQRTNHKIEIIHNTKNMPDLMNWADVAVAAGGTTTWELLFMGVPAILCITTQNQEAIVQSLSDDAVIISLGWLKQLELTKFVDMFTNLITNKTAREQMSIKSQAIVDGIGTQRVAKEIMNLTESC